MFGEERVASAVVEDGEAFGLFFRHCDEVQIAKEAAFLSLAGLIDRSTGIEKRGEPGNEYYCVGEPAQNDRKASAAEETMLLMPDYKVENRHDLAKYQLPQVFMSTRQEGCSISIPLPVAPWCAGS